MSFSDQQVAVINSNSKRLAILAGAGAGKSHTMVGKVKRFIDEGLAPKHIAVITFTNEANDSLIEKLEKQGIDTDGLTTKTLHSFCYYLIKIIYGFNSRTMPKIIQSPDAFTGQFWKLAMTYDKKEEGVFGSRMPHKSWKQYCEYITRWQLNKESPEKIIKDFFDKTPHEFRLAFLNKGYAGDRLAWSALFYLEYESWKQSSRQVDFNDLILTAIKELEKANDRVLGFIRNKFKVIIIDEMQDTNALVVDVLKLMTTSETTVIMVGDIRQCQPSGNVVRLGDGTEKDISEIKVGDVVCSYKRANTYFINNATVTDVCVRQFTGNMYRIATADTSTEMTDSHKLLVKWAVNKKSSGLHCVYLMRRDGRFRIGWCKLFENTGNFHLATRARIEQADAYILKITETKEDASKWESIIATNFGLPSLMFTPVPNNRIYTKENLDFMWKHLAHNNDRGVTCLRKFGKNELYPLFVYKETDVHPKNRDTVFETQACNIEANYMQVPRMIKSKRVSGNREWVDVKTVSYEHVCNVPVYSLNVEGTHTYVTNGGLGVCNSIYSFINASPKVIMGYVDYESFERLSLNYNYRSSTEIVDNGNYFVGHYPSFNIGGDTVPTKPANGFPVVSYVSENEIEEMHKTFELIKDLNTQGFKYKDMCVMYRTNAQAMLILHYCVKNDLPFNIKKDSASIFDRSEMKDILAYLKIFNETDNTKFEDFKRIANKPSRFVSNKALEAASSKSAGELGFGPDLLQEYQSDSKVREFAQKMRAHIRAAKKLPLDQQIDYIMYDVGYSAWWDNSDDKDRFFDLSLYANALREITTEQNTYRGLIKQINEVRKAIKERNSEDGITFTTIHSSKGLEWPVCIVLGVCSRLYPFYRAVDENGREGYEEEARLFYVASTRPIDRLYYSEINGHYGKFQVTTSDFAMQTQRQIIDGDYSYGQENNEEFRKNFFGELARSLE